MVAFVESRMTGYDGDYTTVIETYTRTEWPQTGPDNWCGDFVEQTSYGLV